MAGNWGAILAGLAGGAGSLAGSMDENEKEAERKAAQKLATDTAMLKLADEFGLNPMGEGQSVEGALAPGTMAQLAAKGPSIQLGGKNVDGTTTVADDRQTARDQYGIPRAVTLGERQFAMNPSMGREARKDRATEAKDERTADAAFKRLLQSGAQTQKIAQLNADAAGSRAAEALAGRFVLAGVNNTAAQQRASTMAASQRGMVGGITQIMEGDTPMVTAYTRGGDTRQLGKAPPKTGGATKAETALAAGEAERSYINLLDPRTQKIADPPGWVDRKASQSDVGNVIASDAGGAYMTNVRGLIRSWVVTVEGKRMSDADARVNEMLKSFRFGGGKIADEQTKRRLEGMYRDILKMAGRGPSSPSAPTTAPAQPTSGDRTAKYRSPNG